MPQAEKKAADKACLCRKLHNCACSPTSKVVLRKAASLIAKLKLRTAHKTLVGRDPCTCSAISVAIRARASSDFLVMHGAVALFDPELKWCVRGLKIFETEKRIIGVFDVAAVDLTPAWGWDCVWDPTMEPKTGHSKAKAKRSAAPVSGAPLDGRHSEGAVGVATAAGVLVALWEHHRRR